MLESSLIMQSDASILLDTHADNFEVVRSVLLPFAELIKSPEHFHLYQITRLSVWNAAACGISFEFICDNLNKYSRYPVPENVLSKIKMNYDRYGLLVLEKIKNSDNLFIYAKKDDLILKEISHHPKIKKMLIPCDQGFQIHWKYRGTLKQELINLGWPVEDKVPLNVGEKLTFSLKDNWNLRPYQSSAIKSFLGDMGPGTGFGVITLPCGAGKTMVAVGAIAALQTETLILTVSSSSSQQWKREFLDKTFLPEDQIGEYSSSVKQIRPITLATYQILIWRANKDEEFGHFDLFKQRNWGFIVYDEAHLLPAPVFRVTAELQSIRRLGLTATLVREDGAEKDIFSLIGPKRFDVPWIDLEKQGFIAQAFCFEVHVSLSQQDDLLYVVVEKHAKNRIASTNPRKLDIAKKILAKYPSQPTLIIGQYLSQISFFSKNLNAPMITGKTSLAERERLYDEFRQGKIKLLIVSKVANFAIDLPEARIAIQVSGSFGSRQEEAQRLGRVLRPKDGPSYFYSLVSHMTVEEDFANHRHKFLTEQGYRYQVLRESEI